MSDDRRQGRPDELNRLTDTAGAVESLTQIVEAKEEPLEEALTRVARTAVGAVPDADAVSITVVSEPQSRTAAYTDERVLRLDERQYTSNRGPCLEAARTRIPVRVSMGFDDDRWPEFVTASREEGILATLSIPLIVGSLSPGAEEDSLVGSLNVYSRNAAAFDPFDEVLMSLFATSASQAITNARRWQHSRATVAQLQSALGSRSTIDQAKGVLRAVHGCSADEAFAMLVEKSQHTNVKLHVVAAQLLDSLSDITKRPR
ncbi:GAF and ANTAR domain-containing protein [Mycolicibacterium sp. 050158]|uniref:GAF and ANTAR domain-containing protein n=1 Tax=Mycolicibacterium sp. 050158 TaxID=3090602 RepID=UPI00299E5831|nr:GAF and ANTAR domain-containing protein [Mycolicibacterium sp. 050158]MDX1893423.1 GAF and ANTAR domain-containing protein [Mycolicibacterium sp. 050158]